jgi:uncharacterized protein YcbK (DUF882 family)
MRENKILTGTHGCRSREPAVTRRRLLRLGAIAAIGGIFPRTALGNPGRPQATERALGFFNTHTGERLKAIYWEKGHYIAESLAEINRILRDHRANEVENIDTELLDLLFALQNKLESREPFHVISGYRSAKTNAALQAASSGVAQNSLHLVGKAIDIRTPGRELRMLRKAAVALKGGGVGYYPKSDFVHVDVGRVRYW